MLGGVAVIEGNVGSRAGEKMRRGTVVVRGKTGSGTGTRMIGGTIWAEGGIGPEPGLMMRRGTLIGPSVESLLPTFVDCGKHDLVIMRVIARYLKSLPRGSRAQAYAIVCPEDWRRHGDHRTRRDPIAGGVKAVFCQLFCSSRRLKLILGT